MKIDPLAFALNWFDDYRAGALSALLRAFDKAATIECACEGTKIINGDRAIAEYWKARLVTAPAGEIQNVESRGRDISIHYTTTGGTLMSAAVEINGFGKILSFQCSPVLLN
jgi:hypothetical protein